MKWASFERTWLVSLLHAALPLDDRPVDMDLNRLFERLDTSGPVALRLGLRLAVWTLTVAAPLGAGRARFFPRLSADEQDRILGLAAASRWFVFRQCVIVLKLFACFLSFERAEVRARFLSPS